jgi:hypothetical protein
MCIVAFDSMVPSSFWDSNSLWDCNFLQICMQFLYLVDNCLVLRVNDDGGILVAPCDREQMNKLFPSVE